MSTASTPTYLYTQVFKGYRLWAAHEGLTSPPPLVITKIPLWSAYTQRRLGMRRMYGRVAGFSFCPDGVYRAWVLEASAISRDYEKIGADLRDFGPRGDFIKDGVWERRKVKPSLTNLHIIEQFNCDEVVWRSDEAFTPFTPSDRMIKSYNRDMSIWVGSPVLPYGRGYPRPNPLDFLKEVRFWVPELLTESLEAHREAGPLKMAMMAPVCAARLTATVVVSSVAYIIDSLAHREPILGRNDKVVTPWVKGGEVDAAFEAVVARFNAAGDVTNNSCVAHHWNLYELANPYFQGAYLSFDAGKAPPGIAEAARGLGFVVEEYNIGIVLRSFDGDQPLSIELEKHLLSVSLRRKLMARTRLFVRWLGEYPVEQVEKT